MEIAVCILKYFPYGGLERDCLQMAKECQKRGHKIRVYTFSWEGEIPEGFDVRIVPKKGYTSHSRVKNFSEWVKANLKKHPVSAVFGVNRIEGLDVYFAGDNCIKEKGFAERNFLYRLTPRYKVFTELEKAVFDKDLNTQILYLVERQKNEYQKHYETQDERFHLMPAGISLDRKRPTNADEIREETRKQFGFKETDRVLIEVGSGYFRKGVDRVIIAVSSLPEELRKRTYYMPVGYEQKMNHFKDLAKKLGVEKQVLFLGGRKDVPQLLMASDLMVHPAVDEATGTILMESLAAGLPVMCSGTCGYACYIEKTNAGVVIPEPFKQETFNKELQKILTSSDLNKMAKNALYYAENSDELYSRPQKAADVIEEAIRRKSQHA